MRYETRSRPGTGTGETIYNRRVIDDQGNTIWTASWVDTPGSGVKGPEPPEHLLKKCGVTSTTNGGTIVVDLDSCGSNYSQQLPELKEEFCGKCGNTRQVENPRLAFDRKQKRTWVRCPACKPKRLKSKKKQIR